MSPCPLKRLKQRFPTLSDHFSLTEFSDLARSIMTTDTVPKTASAQGIVEGKTFTVTGVAKGAGMIRPDMATMLCFVCTDVEASPDILKETLVKAADRSFNRITIDGDTSTNDTVMVMANGLSGAVIRSVAHKNIFQKVLDEIFLDLAKQLIRDGEGVTKLVEIMVRGAVSDSDARNVADTVAHSPLVKTSFFGEDANWGTYCGRCGQGGRQR